MKIFIEHGNTQSGIKRDKLFSDTLKYPGEMCDVLHDYIYMCIYMYKTNTVVIIFYSDIPETL